MFCHAVVFVRASCCMDPVYKLKKKVTIQRKQMDLLAACVHCRKMCQLCFSLHTVPNMNKLSSSCAYVSNICITQSFAHFLQHMLQEATAVKLR